MDLSTYSLQELLNKWRREELTGEQLNGHLLQHLLACQQRLTDHEQRLRHLEQARPAASAPGTGKPT